MTRTVLASVLFAVVLAVPAAAQADKKAEESIKFDVNFDKDNVIDKCGGDSGLKCGSITFEGKKESKDKCAEFSKLKHSQLEKLDDAYIKELAVEKKIVAKDGWEKLTPIEKTEAKKLAVYSSAKDALEKKLAEVDKDTSKEEFKKLGCGGLKKLKKALEAETHKCRSRQDKEFKNLTCGEKQ